MITYKTLSVADAFQKASQDATWNKAERAALAAVAKGLFDANWNQAYMAGEIQKDGKDWDGTEEDLRPLAGGIQRTGRWRAIGHGRAWAKGHKEEFLVSEAMEGWSPAAGTPSTLSPRRGTSPGRKIPSGTRMGKS